MSSQQRGDAEIGLRIAESVLASAAKEEVAVEADLKIHDKLLIGSPVMAGAKFDISRCKWQHLDPKDSPLTASIAAIREAATLGHFGDDAAAKPMFMNETTTLWWHDPFSMVTLPRHYFRFPHAKKDTVAQLLNDIPESEVTRFTLAELWAYRDQINQGIAMKTLSSAYHNLRPFFDGVASLSCRLHDLDTAIALAESISFSKKKVSYYRSISALLHSINSKQNIDQQYETILALLCDRAEPNEKNALLDLLLAFCSYRLIFYSLCDFIINVSGGDEEKTVEEEKYMSTNTHHHLFPQLFGGSKVLDDAKLFLHSPAFLRLFCTQNKEENYEHILFVKLVRAGDIILSIADGKRKKILAVQQSSPNCSSTASESLLSQLAQERRLQAYLYSVSSLSSQKQKTNSNSSSSYSSSASLSASDSSEEAKCLALRVLKTVQINVLSSLESFKSPAPIYIVVPPPASLSPFTSFKS